MFESSVTWLEPGRICQFSLYREGQRLSYGDAIAHWQDSADFRLFYSQLLAEAPFEAIFWEAPPLQASSHEQPYEFVLVNAPNLATVSADAQSFAAFFQQSNGPTAVFPNLGGDATLVAPCPQRRDYPHLLKFVRTAPEAALDHFWQTLGKTVEEHLGDRPLWVSTSGLGVYWLHVRLDARPKYYTYRPYRSQAYSPSSERESPP